MDTQGMFDANQKSTQHIREITARLTEKDLDHTLPNGWSIAVTLAHIAFWDQKVIYSLNQTVRDRKVVSILFDDSLNDILAPFLGVIPTRQCVELAIQTAEKLDLLLENCPADLLEGFYHANARWVERSLHRNEHLDDIQKFLQAK
jgi:hypothetical protein